MAEKDKHPPPPAAPRHAPPPPAAAHDAPKPHAEPHAAETTGIPPDQVATDPEAYPFIDTLRVMVTLGPWSGSVLHLPNADAVQAIGDKWAVDYVERPFDANATPPAPLTDEERATALAAAEKYANDHANPPPDQKTEAAPPRRSSR